MKILSFMLIYMSIMSLCCAGQMYKYKDANGNWVFSDQPPETVNTFETLNYTNTKRTTPKIKLYYKNNDAKKSRDNKAYTLHAKNDFVSPIEIGVTSLETNKLIKKVIPAKKSMPLFNSNNKSKNLSYSWALGDPDIVADNYTYHVPYASAKAHKVTQAFNGEFSHTSDYSRYAVDIAMDVGTMLTAARSGTVVLVKDDFHMSGTTNYFLDKANSIQILHDDGTIAVYAHILMDTAMVKEGDKVVQGQRIARSGSSGYSTGPHLHFVIIRNSGLKNIAIPFKFMGNDGSAFTPQKSMIIGGAGNITR